MSIFRKNYAVRVYFENGYTHHIVVFARGILDATYMAFRAFPKATQANARIIE